MTPTKGDIAVTDSPYDCVFPEILIEAKGGFFSENPASVRRPIHEEVVVRSPTDFPFTFFADKGEIRDERAYT